MRVPLCDFAQGVDKRAPPRRVGPSAALGQKPKSAERVNVARLAPKADIERHDGHVCFVPGADMSRSLEQLSRIY